MSKGKLQKFAEMETFKNVFQYPFSVIEQVPFEMKGRWREEYFHNDRPIVLELGCGKGEYTVGLAKLFPDMNFIGVDIKGARMHKGAKEALDEGLANVAFLRTNIEIIDRFFGEDEVQEIWLTFSDPQMKNPHKRLSSTFFMERYRRFLTDGGLVHLKTDSNFLFTYTTYMVERNRLPLLFRTEDLYHDKRLRLSADHTRFFFCGANEPEEKEQQTFAGEAEENILPNFQTYYESQWIERGLNIKYMRFALPREGRLEEPQVEIELDDYRSYKRPKRSSLEKAQ